VVFLTMLHFACIHHQLHVHGYVLMTNHVHLLATPQIANAVSLTMQAVGRQYVPYFNRRYSRTGGLFEGRFRSTVVTTESYWFNCMRYVELNPVRADMVSRPEAYPWSSFSSNAMGMPDGLLMPHELYLS
jgi:putative transposase